MKKKKLFLLTGVFLVFLIGISVFPLEEEKLHKPLSQAIYDKEGKLIRAFLSSDEKWRIACGLKEVSPYLIKTVISIEDRFYYYHPGINPWSLIRALYLNVKHKRIIAGGSTITMQVARMMEHRQRTFLSKLIEIIRALKLELCYSKKELLELYFNMASYGGNVEGVGAACYYYFQKNPSEISLAQAALLAVIPNSPRQLNPEKHPQRVKGKRDKILNYLLRKRVITKEEYNRAIEEEIKLENPGMPFNAPHFTDLTHRLYPNKVRIYTTLNRDIQNKCEKVLRQHLKKWRSMGISNGAIVVISNSTNSMRALVGSYDFFDDLNSGQVNGATSTRSPGSTLKPFLYAFGMDRGLITPSTVLYDVPVDYSGYIADNYDGRYHGVVTVKEALVRSLNVPAVLLLAQIGVGDFITFLKEGGISTIDPRQNNYGLSLILGGCGIKLVELTNLYSTMANGGKYRVVRYHADEPIDHGRRILSAGSSYIITELLSEVVRPEMPVYWEFSLDRPKVAWKTGTSYGRRDAWSIGYTRNFTVGVWVGNFDGRSAPDIVGAEVAGLILFDVFNAISRLDAHQWFNKPGIVSSRRVCARSGMVPSEDCPYIVEDICLAGVSSNQKCHIHKGFYIDNKTGYRISRSDLQNRSYEKKVFEVWPREVATWLKRNGYPLDEVPPLLPVYQDIMAGEGPIIHSPNAGCAYRIRKGMSIEYQKILLDASVDNSVNKIFWFLDGKLIWAGDPKEQVFIYPQTGDHVLVCQDDHGRATSMNLVIK